MSHQPDPRVTPPPERRLTNIAPWRLRTAIAVVVGLLLIGGVASSGLPGRGVAVLIPLALMVAYLVPTLARTRHGLAVDGYRLYVRRLVRWRMVAGRDVTEVVQVFSPGSPNVRLRTTGDARGVVAPTADLDRGHSTVFGWLFTYAPQARLDPAAERTADLLRQRGLLDDAPPPRPAGQPADQPDAEP